MNSTDIICYLDSNEGVPHRLHCTNEGSRSGDSEDAYHTQKDDFIDCIDSRSELHVSSAILDPNAFGSASMVPNSRLMTERRKRR